MRLARSRCTLRLPACKPPWIKGAIYRFHFAAYFAHDLDPPHVGSGRNSLYAVGLRLCCASNRHEFVVSYESKALPTRICVVGVSCLGEQETDVVSDFGT